MRRALLLVVTLVIGASACSDDSDRYADACRALESHQGNRDGVVDDSDLRTYVELHAAVRAILDEELPDGVRGELEAALPIFQSLARQERMGFADEEAFDEAFDEVSDLIVSGGFEDVDEFVEDCGLENPF